MSQRVTNYDLLIEITKLKEQLIPIRDDLSEVRTDIYGNGKVGLKTLVERIYTGVRVVIVLIGLIGTLAGILVGCNTLSLAYHADTDQRVATTIAATMNTIGGVGGGDIRTSEALPTPTATIAPTSSIFTLTPRPTTTAVPGIIEVTEEEVDHLAGLCVVEVRGFGLKREDACLSVISTVFARMKQGYLSDGTIDGTITWNCKAGDLACQFPAWVVNGCEGIQGVACPANYPADMRYFVSTVYRFLMGNKGSCHGFRFYGSRPLDMGDCIITGQYGSKEGFHN